MSDLLFSTADRPVAAQELYIVTDQDDKELMAMPLNDILRQSLYFRLVMLAMINRERKLILQKSSIFRAAYPGKWDVFTAPVKAGVSRLETALGLLHEEACIPQDLQMHERAWLPQTVTERPYSLTLFFARPPEGAANLASQRGDIMLVDEDELNGLMADDEEMFVPALIKMQKMGLLFL